MTFLPADGTRLHLIRQRHGRVSASPREHAFSSAASRCRMLSTILPMHHTLTAPCGCAEARGIANSLAKNFGVDKIPRLVVIDGNTGTLKEPTPARLATTSCCCGFYSPIEQLAGRQWSWSHLARQGEEPSSPRRDHSLEERSPRKSRVEGREAEVRADALSARDFVWGRHDC